MLQDMPCRAPHFRQIRAVTSDVPLHCRTMGDLGVPAICHCQHKTGGILICGACGCLSTAERCPPAKQPKPKRKAKAKPARVRS